MSAALNARPPIVAGVDGATFRCARPGVSWRLAAIGRGALNRALIFVAGTR